MKENKVGGLWRGCMVDENVVDKGVVVGKGMEGKMGGGGGGVGVDEYLMKGMVEMYVRKEMKR